MQTVVRHVALLALITFAAGVAQAAPPRPTRFLKAQVSEVRKLLKVPAKPGTPEAVEIDRKLRGFIDPVMEFDRLSERALGKHWAGLKPEQRQAFIKTFRDLVYRSYLKKVRSADENYTVEYEDEDVRGNEAVVGAVAKTKKAEIELVFHLEARDDARWVAADIVIDEVSLVGNYREQFNKIIADEGFDALLKKMRDKLEELGGPMPEEVAAPAEKAAPAAAKNAADAPDK